MNLYTKEKTLLRKKLFLLTKESNLSEEKLYNEVFQTQNRDKRYKFAHFWKYVFIGWWKNYARVYATLKSTFTWTGIKKCSCVKQANGINLVHIKINTALNKISSDHNRLNCVHNEFNPTPNILSIFLTFSTSFFYHWTSKKCVRRFF